MEIEELVQRGVNNSKYLIGAGLCGLAVHLGLNENYELGAIAWISAVGILANANYTKRRLDFFYDTIPSLVSEADSLTEKIESF